GMLGAGAGAMAGGGGATTDSGAMPGGGAAPGGAAPDGGAAPGGGAAAGGGTTGGGSTDSGVKAAETATEAGTPDAGSAANLDKFSFFVTSLESLRKLSKSQKGFGGDLRFGETGEGAGLRGADKICSTIAEMSMPGSSAKQWRAFLSTSKVHAK